MSKLAFRMTCFHIWPSSFQLCLHISQYITLSFWGRELNKESTATLIKTGETIWVIPILPFKMTAFLWVVWVFICCVTKLCGSLMVRCNIDCTPVTFIQSGLSNVTVPKWRCLLCLCLGLVSSTNKTSETLDHLPVVSLMSNTVVGSSLAYLSTLFGVVHFPYFNCKLPSKLVFNHIRQKCNCGP